MEYYEDEALRIEALEAVRIKAWEIAESESKSTEIGDTFVHRYGHGDEQRGGQWACETDKRGYAQPRGGSPLEIVVDATDGFIPLWDANVLLRWRFNEQSLAQFVNPEGAKDYVRAVMAEALWLWGDAVPVKFTEAKDIWDFEIKVSAQENCSPNGCTLARAFFPDGGQHDITVFPTMFDQSVKEQIDTMAHEFGHVFGLRHFFALVTETAWPAEIFGDHDRFSIMNYGHRSEMSDADRADLTALYSLARSRQLTEINGTPIKLVRPFSAPDPICVPDPAA